MTRPLGLSTGACIDAPILDVLPILAASGATGVEISTPPRHFDLWQETQITAVDRALRSLELRAISIHAPFGRIFDLADPNPRHRTAAIDAILTASAALKRLGGRIVVVHPSDLARHEHDPAARVEDCIASLTVLATRFARMEMTMVVESPLPHLIGGHPNEFAAILNGLDPSVGVCLDTGHTGLGRHWGAFVQVSGARLTHVHAHDNHGVRDDHLTPGDGALDWREIRDTLDDARFSGWLMVELHCPVLPLSDTFRRALDRGRELLGAD